MKTAIILFGHGSREPRWVEPFERLAATIRDRVPNVEVQLAFLEQLRPDLISAAAELIANGVESIRVVPVFIGEGGHVRTDLPVLIDRLCAENPGVRIDCLPAVGQDDEVLAALASYSVRDLR